MLVIKGRVEARRYQHNERAWHAWHTAALPNMKRFPPLSDLVSRETGSRPKAQTPEQIKAVMNQWRAAMSGRAAQT